MRDREREDKSEVGENDGWMDGWMGEKRRENDKITLYLAIFY